MEAISAGGAQTAPKISLAVNLSETPRRPDEAATVNNRVNAVQTVVDTQASLNATQTVPQVQQSGAAENSLEQQLRQTAVQANSDRNNDTDAAVNANQQSAVSAFRNVSQLSNGDTSAIGSSAGLNATTDSTANANTNRLNIEV